MSLVPHFKPETIEHMPDTMFAGIQNALPLASNEINITAKVRWETGREIPSFEHRLLDILEPYLDAIIKTERLRIKFIEFSIRNGFVEPGKNQSPAPPDWHRDGGPFDRLTTYIIANAFTTEFLGGFRPEPGDLVRFARKKHRAPTNHTDQPIPRTLVRALVHHY